jgi:chitodextrinase
VYSNDRVVGSTTGVSFVDSGLWPETRYCYRVVAVGASGNESPAQPPVCITTASPPTAARRRVLASGSP